MSTAKGATRQLVRCARRRMRGCRLSVQVGPGAKLRRASHALCLALHTTHSTLTPRSRAALGNATLRCVSLAVARHHSLCARPVGSRTLLASALWLARLLRLGCFATPLRYPTSPPHFATPPRSSPLRRSTLGSAMAISHVVHLAIPLLLSLHGYRSGSLSRSGSACAFAVGYLSLLPPTHYFSVLLFSFYLAGSRATKYGHAIKRTLSSSSGGGGGDDGEKAGGNRSAVQVLCTSLVGVVGALLYQVADSIEAKRWAVLLALGHYATALGDTLASELGVLSKQTPRLVTTGRPVPKGTNGGITAWGTLVSLLGGTALGALAAGVEAAQNDGLWNAKGINVVLLATAAAGVGSLLDSLLGATLQETVTDRQGKVVTDPAPDAASRKAYTVIAGSNLLSNHQVNFLSSLLVALGTAMLGAQHFR
ncbi:hypothetical protein ACQY0O_002048 [Thecaphora frezii]